MSQKTYLTLGIVLNLVLLACFFAGWHPMRMADRGEGRVFLLVLGAGTLGGSLFLWWGWRTLTAHQETIEQLMGLKLALASLIDLKDPYTEGHSRNVRDLAYGFCQYLGLPERVSGEIMLAAELHDIGKIGMPDTLLHKKEKLSAEDFNEVKKHPDRGADALKSLKGFDAIRGIIRHHHEKFDGTGYPEGIRGEAIPLGARVIALADCYDALIHGRVYRPALSQPETLKILQSERSRQFDPALLPPFIRFLKQKIAGGDIDPVCGMSVSGTKGRWTARHQGADLGFCSETCREAFLENPEKYQPAASE